MLLTLDTTSEKSHQTHAALREPKSKKKRACIRLFGSLCDVSALAQTLKIDVTTLPQQNCSPMRLKVSKKSFIDSDEPFTRGSPAHDEVAMAMTVVGIKYS